jgi:hypothetical protein
MLPGLGILVGHKVGIDLQRLSEYKVARDSQILIGFRVIKEFRTSGTYGST